MERSIVLALVLLGAAPAAALDRAPVPGHLRADLSDAWSTASSCTITCYNICTGWYWIWGGYDEGDRLAVRYSVTSCTDVPPTVEYTHHYLNPSGPPGYGFSAMITEVGPDGCPGEVLASQPFQARPGWNTLVWRTPVPGSPEGFFVVWRVGTYLWGGHVFVTDHPSAGPTGPAACGLCFPVDRPVHSFYLPDYDTFPCPGFTWYGYDGPCTAELMWSIQGNLADSGPVAVESASWARVKAMYR